MKAKPSEDALTIKDVVAQAKDAELKWSLISRRLPGRTDNEIKNYWNTYLGKKVKGDDKKEKVRNSSLESNLEIKPIAPQVIRSKAVRCTKVIIPWQLDNNQIVNKNLVPCGDSSRHEAKLEDSMDEANTQNSRVGTPFHPNMDLNTLASFLNSEDEWTS
ncbi:transcription factor tt2 [Quercus suber]|uniref:Transcription factor tt2 n=1 Tax=Quercus suber TaxID=58331 RepID=A0AAW0J891_QUESU